jgi:hypothetical protein
MFYKNMYAHFEIMAEKGAISKDDMDLFLYTDSVQEAMEHIKKHGIEQFQLRKKKIRKVFPLFGEKH